jgi:hypothetical protein
MTDATQTDIAANSYAAARPAPRSGHLFGPVFDFLALGGGSLIVCGLIALLLPEGISNFQLAILITLLMTLINQPHFAHSYQMFYRGFKEKAFGESYAPDLRRRYIIAGLVVPVLLVAGLTAGVLSGSARLLSYAANVMFFLVGWHYVKQGYGILIVDSVQKRIMFSDAAKTILRANGYACWLVAWFGLNHAIAKATPALGLTFYTLPLPTILYQAAIAVAGLTTIAALGVFLSRWREARALPWNGVVAYLATLYLWVIFVRVNPLVLAVVPTFHSLQYLAVVWRYQLNAGAATSRHASFLDGVWAPGTQRSLALFVGFGILLGYLGFMGMPWLLDASIGYNRELWGPSLAVFLFYIFINVHHYFLDNVMWRRGNPDIQKHLFARAR